MGDEAIIEERKEKLFRFLKRPSVWIIGVLIIAVILGVYIRSLPMTDHGGNPGLWDIAKDDWTLGPDLDPWFFTRHAKTIVEEGGLPEIDMMRMLPFGFETSRETRLLPYMIAYTHKIVSVFADVPVEFSAALFPVLMFALTIIVFFLFVREIFIRKSERSKIRAGIIALISTFFMIVIPVFLSRTIAGIPEKESAAFFFMFFAFWLFLKAWKSESLKKSLIFAGLAGISTGAMGLIWGGVSYVFVTIAIAGFIGFILNKFHKREIMVYGLWLLVSWGLMWVGSARFTLNHLINSLDLSIAFVVFYIILIHIVIWKTKLKDYELLRKIKLPKNIISIIIAILFGVLILAVILGPSFIFKQIGRVNQMMFKPITGRWDVTVAENRQPYFTEWGGNFGPHIRNIPILFWMFFVGSVVLFKKMLRRIKNKDKWILTILYILFFFGLVFSRYSPESALNGENFISKFIYYGSALLLIGFAVYVYTKYNREGNKSFERIVFEYIFLFSLFVLVLFTARSAVRLIMILAPIAVIFLGYLIVASIEKFRRTKEDVWKIILGMIMILILVLSLFVFTSFYSSTKAQAYNFIPGPYNQQWQKAMAWVRDNTPENAVFSHWWDYGYWLQSIGERATFLDGGNPIPFWNYYMGRLVLTGDNQHDALEYLYNHNATHLLIDSTDIGKYGAFSSIGSNEDFDRFSWIQTMTLDKNQIQETGDGMVRVYQGGVVLDEDIIYIMDDGVNVFLPGGKAAIGGIIVRSIENEEGISFEQPEGVFFYQNKQYKIPLRYLYFNGEFKDFGSGLEATPFFLQVVSQSSDGIQVDNLGSMIYISPRVMRGMLAQKYLLNDPFDNFPNFKISYIQEDLVVESLKAQGLNVNSFIYFQGLKGPIKIWEIEYTGQEKYREDYIDDDPDKYLSWQL